MGVMHAGEAHECVVPRTVLLVAEPHCRTSLLSVLEAERRPSATFDRDASGAKATDEA
jgi:hypothetical protein